MAEKEYIEREEVREAFRMEFDNAYADDITDRLPTADVQEIVRCKDCKKFCPYLSFCDDNCIGAFGHCQITHMNVSPNFYCGNAEKKDKE